jgi:hypothetical protein
MTEYSPDVVFNAGAPIDVNKLNQLQRNIASIYQTNSIVNTTSNTVAGLEKEVRTFPIIDVGSITISVNEGQCVQKTITFSNKNFTETPQIVASVSSNIKKDSALTVRATSTSTSQATIEVCSNSKYSQDVNVQYIAIQMKQFD